jgi:hypothetical protein
VLLLLLLLLFLLFVSMLLFALLLFSSMLIGERLLMPTLFLLFSGNSIVTNLFGQSTFSLLFLPVANRRIRLLAFALSPLVCFVSGEGSGDVFSEDEADEGGVEDDVDDEDEHEDELDTEDEITTGEDANEDRLAD